MTSQRKNLLLWGALVLALSLFWWLNSSSFHWTVADESIYVYFSWASLEHGLLPYRDYFFAHPPLHLFWAVPHFIFWGIHPISVKAIPLLAVSLTTFFLFLISLEKLGRVGAIATVLSFLCADTVLRSAGGWTGVHESVLWAVLGLWLFFREKPLFSGIALALGVGTGNYILPGASLIGLLFFARGIKTGKYFLAGFLPVWGLVQGVGLSLGGLSYFQSVYLYHFKKPLAHYPAWKDSWLYFSNNFSLTWMGLLGFFIAATASLKCKNEKARVALVGLAWSLTYLCFLQLLSRRFNFYYYLSAPGFALGAGFLAQDLSDQGSLLKEKNWVYPATVCGILALGFIFLNVKLPNLNRPDQTKLFHSLSKYIKENSLSGEKLFGDSLTVGTVAFLSRRRLIDDFADTNTMRFVSGVTLPEEVIRAIDRPDLRFILAEGRLSRRVENEKTSLELFRFASLSPFRDWLEAKFRLAWTTPSNHGTSFYLFERKK